MKEISTNTEKSNDIGSKPFSQLSQTFFEKPSSEKAPWEIPQKEQKDGNNDRLVPPGYFEKPSSEKAPWELTKNDKNNILENYREGFWISSPQIDLSLREKLLIKFIIALAKFTLSQGGNATIDISRDIIPTWLANDLWRLYKYAEDHDGKLVITINGNIYHGTGWSPFDDDNIEDFKDHFIGVNDGLGGTEHPHSHVPFIEKEIINENGETEKHSFPVFDSKFDLQLLTEMYKATDAEQFTECNRQLKEAVNKDPNLASQFTSKQLEQIRNGDKPGGYTWHHNEDAGKMQLVDTKIHQATRHLGGRVIWGGGTGYRNNRRGENNE